MQKNTSIIIKNMNWLTFCHIVQAGFQFILNTILVTKFFSDINLALYFLLFAASTVTVNHFRWAIPTFLIKDITELCTEQVITIIIMLTFGFCVSAIQFYFIDGQFDVVWWYVYIYSAFLFVYLANFLGAIKKYKTYCIALVVSGVCVGFGSIWIFTGDSLNIRNLSFIIALSQLVPALIMLISSIFNRVQKPALRKNPKKNQSYRLYIKFIFYEIPTRPIPFIEKYIANLISPTVLISMEIIQRLCLRPVSLLLIGRVFKKSVFILRNNASVTIGEIAYSILGKSYIQIIMLVLFPIVILKLYSLSNSLNTDVYFVAVVMIITLLIVNVLDLYRKKLVSDGYVDRIMLVNIFMGMFNVVFLLFTYYLNWNWVFISIGSFLNAVFTIFILNVIQMRDKAI